MGLRYVKATADPYFELLYEVAALMEYRVAMDSFYSYGNPFFAYLKQSYVSLLSLSFFIFYGRRTYAPVIYIQIAGSLIEFNRRRDVGMPRYKNNISVTVYNFLKPCILFSDNIRRHIRRSLGIVRNKRRMAHHDAVFA